MASHLKTDSKTKGETNGELLDTLELHDALPGARFAELHKRTVDLPIEKVWPAAVDVSANEVRLFAPLIALRGVPALLMGKRPPMPVGNAPLLDLFIEEGFVLLRKDEDVVNGRAVVLFGAASKFWSVAHNQPVKFDSAADFMAFDEPGYAKTVGRIEAIADGETTRLETETLVAGNDPASDKKFAPYWMIIRGPSGLIRRSWLAAIDRKAHR